MSSSINSSINDADVEETTEVVVIERVVTTESQSSSTSGGVHKFLRSFRRQKMSWMGIVALQIVMLLSMAQMLVLKFSNDKSAWKWPASIEPNVCLSLLNGLASMAQAFAVIQGIATAWWMKAVQGSSIEKLHYSWNFGSSMMSILFKFKYFDVIALAVLVAKIAVADSVLFQRATQTFEQIDWSTDNLASSAVLAYSRTEFPRSGYMSVDNDTSGVTNYAFSALNTQNNYIEQCLGIGCVYGLNGAGFAIDCNTTQGTSLSPSYDSAGVDYHADNTIFSINWQMLFPDSQKNYSSLAVTTKWRMYDPSDSDNSSASLCPGEIRPSICEVRPAVVNYTVAYTNASSIERSKLCDKDYHPDQAGLGDSGTRLSYSCFSRDASFETIARTSRQRISDSDADCSLYSPQWRQLKGVEVLQISDVHEPYVPGGNSSLVGIFNVIKDSFDSQAILHYQNEDYSATQTGSTSIFSDHQSYMFARLNELMLQNSVDADLYAFSADSEMQKYYHMRPSAQFYRDIYYTTDYRYAGAALALTALVIICILPSYRGFWHLGRDVSLGPVEIAYVFQAPALVSGTDHSGHANEIVRNVGKLRVQYGEVSDGDGRRTVVQMA